MPQFDLSCQTCQPSDACSKHNAPFFGSLTLTFAHVRQNLLTSLPSQVADGTTSLAAWRPNSDLGQLLLESWAYVGDVLGTYASVVATESYLQVAEQRRSQRRITALLGYQSRPAVAPSTVVVALVDGDSVQLDRTAYRASPPNSPPQVFESTVPITTTRRANEFALAPLRSADAPAGERGTYLIDPTTAGPVRGRPVAFIWFDDLINVIKSNATEIVDVNIVTGTDGDRYVTMSIADDTNFIGTSVTLERVSLQSPSQRAYPCTHTFALPNLAPIVELPEPLDVNSVADILSVKPGGHKGTSSPVIDTTAISDKSQGEIWLDGVYRAVNASDLIILQAGAKFAVHRVIVTDETLVPLANAGPDAPKLPITRLTIYPAVADGFVDFADPTNLVIHYNLHDIGRLTRVAHTELTTALVLGTDLPLEGIHDKPPPGSEPTEFILEDANGRGVLVEGTLDVTDSGAATLDVTALVTPWPGDLRVPVKAYGNVVQITRGELVQDELLGDGDAAQRWQTFKLAKSPLTYLNAAGTTDGIVSTLEVRVDGIRWHERPTFYGAGPQDPVYIVRHDDDQNTFITFGDGIRGRRVPTGVRNVRATYRHGAGAEVPPPGSINQIVKGAPGLVRVRSPIPASGGADAESARDIQRNAPASALVLGRCVSLADFAARVARFPGVRNSKVEYAWDEASLSAGVKVWYVPNNPGADLSADIVVDLQAMSEPGLVIRATPATPISTPLFINLEIDRDHLPADVEAALHSALLDPETGLLAPANTPIGGPLARSALVAVARAIPGVLDITSVHYGIDAGPDSFPAPGLLLPAGHYLDYDGDNAGNLLVHAVATESRGCRDLAI